MEKYFKLVGLFSLGLILLGACQPSTPPPTATITSTILGNVVKFNLATTNATAYKWNFGDGDTAIVYSDKTLTHAYAKDGTTYSVTLLVLGPGGQVTANTSVTVPVMTKMEMLTGGVSFANGKAWRISSFWGINVANPDSGMTVVKNYPAGVLTLIGLGQAYTDKYIFFSNGNYTISPQSDGILTGLTYCTVNSISNVQPQAADSVGLTYATPYTPPTGLTFALNVGKKMTIATTADGIIATNVTYNNLNTLSFSTNGFIGLRDFMSECVVQQLAPNQMTIAFFVSNAPSQAPQVGKITNILIVTFEVAL